MGSGLSGEHDDTPTAATKKIAASALQGAVTKAQSEQAMITAFKSFDSDGNGTISKKEFAAVLSKLNMKMTARQIDLLFDTVDKDQDGHIEFEELVCWLCGTPCFTKYFEELDSILREYSEKIKPVGRGDAVIKNAESVNQWLTKELERRIRPVVKQVFHQADKDSNGILSEEESVLLFSNYAHTLAKHADTIIQISKPTWLEKGHWDRQSFKKLVMPNLHHIVTAQMSDYESHIDDRHRQAFNVIDKNKDGHLILDEVVQCLTPGTYRYREFHKALQLYTPEGFKEAFDAVITAKPKRCPKALSERLIQFLIAGEVSLQLPVSVLFLAQVSSTLVLLQSPVKRKACSELADMVDEVERGSEDRAALRRRSPDKALQVFKSA
ncbi:CML10, partial [Symbiodinium microadriaticum]